MSKVRLCHICKEPIMMLQSAFNLSQVLLISGGESLEPDERVCKYTAGSSDTNPIFLFSMARYLRCFIAEWK